MITWNLSVAPTAFASQTRAFLKFLYQPGWSEFDKTKPVFPSVVRVKNPGDPGTMGSECEVSIRPISLFLREEITIFMRNGRFTYVSRRHGERHERNAHIFTFVSNQERFDVFGWPTHALVLNELWSVCVNTFLSSRVEHRELFTIKGDIRGVKGRQLVPDKAWRPDSCATAKIDWDNDVVSCDGVTFNNVKIRYNEREKYNIDREDLGDNADGTKFAQWEKRRVDQLFKSKGWRKL